VLSALPRAYPLSRVVSAAWNRRILPVPSGERTARYPDGRKMRLDLSDRTQRIMFCNTYEHTETDATSSLLRPGDVLVDAGAHVGWYTILAARKIGTDGHVYAFEPDPDNYQLLAQNVRLNQLENVSLAQVALHSEAGSMSVGRQSDSGSITARPVARQHVETVVAETLDRMVPRVPVRLLKIDVEGLEPEVITGATGVLSRTDHVLVETNQHSDTETQFALELAGFRLIRRLSRMNALFGR
jgi:FkbM family methyltransferase